MAEKGAIFDLHRRMIEDYRDFVYSFIHIADERARKEIEELLRREPLWPEPLLQLSPNYARGHTIDELVEMGLLHRDTALIFRKEDGSTYHLYKHQEDAIRKALRGESIVVTTGTGSGKSFCYFIPIVDTVLKHGNLQKPVAFVVYPMNALVNSQLVALEKFKQGYEKWTGREFPVTFAKYTGETEQQERDRIRNDPPHIILTNYMMLELILVRREDKPLLASGGSHLFLVFDELHTYRGRQGADVAVLVRRLKARLQRQSVVHIGTSATIAARKDATSEERRQIVTDFTSRFFGAEIPQQNVIEETLELVTEGGMPTEEELQAAVSAPLPETEGDFKRNALARWVERILDAEERGGEIRHGTPRSLKEVAEELAKITGVDRESCREQLESLLLRAQRFRRADGMPLFAFKLHQFVSQGRAVFATLEAPDKRCFAFEEREEGNKVWAPLRFCRLCGQDHYRVILKSDKFLPAALGEETTDEDLLCYLTPISEGMPGLEEFIPSVWFGANGRLSSTWRARVPKKVWVFPNGSFTEEQTEGAVAMWLQENGFWVCPHCGEFYTARESEFTKLAVLSSEGRSSATTVLATTLLRLARKTKALKDKLLTFTDNRQDASLQAGHFNDFVHVAVLRAALYQALKDHKVLRFKEVASEVVKRMGLDISDIAREPSLSQDSPGARRVMETFADLTEYRLCVDLKRGWRVVQPNLEDAGLLRIRYDGLEPLAQQSEVFSDIRFLCDKSPQERHEILHTFLDYFRKRLAIEAEVLTREKQRRLRKAAEELSEFWGIDPDVGLQEAPVMLRPGDSRWFPQRHHKLTARTLLGRYLRRRLGIASVQDAETLIDQLLELLVKYGFLCTVECDKDHRCYRLNPGCLLWCLGDGEPPPPDPVWSHRRVTKHLSVNKFFQNFYKEMASELAALEAREHTAQVVAAGEREKREKRFRGDVPPPLPYLVCSPTMELGIDIADLDMVHMRNVPPTPANYAQRGGRAARQGQPGLIIVYCGAYNHHDRYFFRNKQEMVAGSVRAPKIDLTNEALIRAHIHAEWLAQVGLHLVKSSVEDILDIKNEEQLPLREGIKEQIRLSHATLQEVEECIRNILRHNEEELDGVGWFNWNWVRRALEQAPEEFDKAFDRWRELYRAALTQLKRANEMIMVHDRKKQEEGMRLQDEARRQLNLLLQVNVAREESDFYPYRYLATEGFLPGYNFPRLPVRAWIPRRGAGDFISRPRFLAIRELAPHNIIYHEGAKWEVVRFQSAPGGLEQRLTTFKICKKCSAFAEASDDICSVCGTALEGANSDRIRALEMPNVAARRRERINCNEEERLRRGYKITVAFRFAPSGTDHNVVVAEVKNLLNLQYAPAATIFLVNHGWRARNNRGFRVDLSNGELISEKEERRQTEEVVKLFVRDTQNLLRIRLLAEVKATEKEAFETTMLYALKRGIERVFQVEEREIEGDLIGEGEARAMLFYEAAEGGVGVLRRLVEEKDALAVIAEEALRILHFEPETGKDLSHDTHKACYECLRSFSNQPKVRLLNRYLVKDFLLKLTRAEAQKQQGGRNCDQHYLWLLRRVDEHSTLEVQFLKTLYEGGYKLPDEAQKRIKRPSCVVDFFYRPNICVFCDGPAHDVESQRSKDTHLRHELRNYGYRVVAIRHDKDLNQQISEYPEIFGVAHYSG